MTDGSMVLSCAFDDVVAAANAVDSLCLAL
jgi:hypothetical protein